MLNQDNRSFVGRGKYDRRQRGRQRIECLFINGVRCHVGREAHPTEGAPASLLICQNAGRCP
ncbi:MAG: hypothetical protein RLN85_21590, partial [Pseudomonadales bacterium]